MIAVAVRFTLLSLVVFGLAYPLATMGVATALFPREAAGSLVMRDGVTVGSSLVGQRFTSPAYVHGRPSAAGGAGYDPTATGATNLGPTSKKLREAIRAAIASVRRENPDASGPVPIDLVTSSGSGIDPDVTPAAARYQLPRIARARGVPLAALEALVASHVEGPQFGLFGAAHVDVLALDLALDARYGIPRRSAANAATARATRASLANDSSASD